jgi:hypothetical protein
VARGIQAPAPARKRQNRRKYARVGGSFPSGARLPDDGVLTVPVLILGDSWPQVTTRLLDMLEAIDLDEFYIETELSGVRTRWYCDAPVEFDEVTSDRKNNRQTYELRFLVQPNPSVTLV